MRAADTNLLVRLLARDDSQQVIAVEDFIESGAWVSHLVLVEAIWVLKSLYGRDRRETIMAVEMLLKHTSLVLQDPDTVDAALAHFRAAHASEFSDCLILELARKHGHLPLGTFDRRVCKLPGARRV